MTFKHLYIEHEKSPDVEAWIEEERAEQEARFDTIVRAMEALGPKREQWYQEFFDRITTLGFNQDGDQKVKIAPAELPVQPPGRPDRVIWKYGTDTAEED
jgi:hypothetical protein